MSHDLGRISEERLDWIEPPGELDHDSDNNSNRCPGTRGHCDARWYGQSIAHCGRCHLTFTSVTGFDVHRYKGRCRSTQELQHLGYEPKSAGHWRKPIEDAPQHWGSDRPPERIPTTEIKSIPISTVQVAAAVRQKATVPMALHTFDPATAGEQQLHAY